MMWLLFILLPNPCTHIRTLIAQHLIKSINKHSQRLSGENFHHWMCFSIAASQRTDLGMSFFLLKPTLRVYHWSTSDRENVSNHVTKNSCNIIRSHCFGFDSMRCTWLITIMKTSQIASNQAFLAAITTTTKTNRTHTHNILSPGLKKLFFPKASTMCSKL